MTSILIALVRWYQRYLSPLWPGSCRFRPTCSQYMLEAIDSHGLKGVLLGLVRLSRCHPLSKGGIDPVPEKIAPPPDNQKALNGLVPDQAVFLTYWTSDRTFINLLTLMSMMIEALQF